MSQEQMMKPETAFRHLAANRRARNLEIEATKPFVVRRLTKAGKVNQMEPPRGFHTREEARLYVAQVRDYNPGWTFRYTINGEEV